MRWLSTVAVAFLCFLLAPPAHAVEDAPLHLETTTAEIQIARSPAPYVARLVHKASGTVVVAEPGDKNLFVLVLDKDGRRQYVQSSTAKQSNAVVEAIDGGTKAVLRFAQLGEPDLSAEVSGVCRQDEPLSQWSIRVHGTPGCRIVAVQFPIITAVPAIGSPDDDFLVLPYLPGTLIENPAKNWNVGQSVTLQFPADQSAQFLAYQDRIAGVYLAGMDAGSHPMSLALSKRAEGFALRHEYSTLAKPAQDWESPYPVALGVTQGGWYDTADIYKQWAVRQPWCAKTLVERDDIPAWWKAGPAVHAVEVRTFDSDQICNGSYYPKLLDHLRAFREKIDGPVLPMLSGWENHRRFTAGDYFPIFDEPEARPRPLPVPGVPEALGTDAGARQTPLA